MSNTQEKYIHSLKQIKEAEEKAHIEIEKRKKTIADEIKNFQEDVEKTEAAKMQAEKSIEESIEQARKKAAKETEKIVEEAKTKTKTITSNVNAQLAQEIIDILLKGVQ
jgi:vacuolar-type H+-ATPase subunit H